MAHAHSWDHPTCIGKRGTTASVNFITCHDGFTLRDMVTYERKRNEANGEDNRDGADWNDSWNCGVEGETSDLAINRLRRQQMCNALVLLFVSQGVPMVLMGDELGHTQHGNNNTYCQDNALSWIDWKRGEQWTDMGRFMRGMIAFRRAHGCLRTRAEKRPAYQRWGQELTWHGLRLRTPDVRPESRTLAFLARGWTDPADAHLGPYDDFVYVAMNMDWRDHDFEVPRLPAHWSWHVFVDTARDGQARMADPGSEPRAALDDGYLPVPGRSIAILVGKR